MANTGFLIQPKKKKEVLPSEYTTMGDFPAVGQQYVYYKALDTGIFYKWDGDSYEVINPAMDVNNQFTSVSGLPQATMDNPIDSPTYRVLNTTACPVSEEATLEAYGVYTPTPSPYFTVTAYLSGAITTLSVDLNVGYSLTYREDGVDIFGGSGTIVIPAGESAGTDEVIPEMTVTTVESVSVTITSVSPNPAGGTTIIY